MDIGTVEVVIGAFVAMSGVMVAVVRLGTKSTKELIAELRKDNTAQGLEIKALQKSDREKVSALAESQRRGTDYENRIAVLETNLSTALAQLHAVHQRLNREEHENNLKAEVITDQEKRIATLEREALRYRTQRDEARLALALLSKREGKEDTDTKDLTEAAARVTAVVNGEQEQTDETKPQEA